MLLKKTGENKTLFNEFNECLGIIENPIIGEDKKIFDNRIGRDLNTPKQIVYFKIRNLVKIIKKNSCFLWLFYCIKNNVVYEIGMLFIHYISISGLVMSKGIEEI